MRSAVPTFPSLPVGLANRSGCGGALVAGGGVVLSAGRCAVNHAGRRRASSPLRAHPARSVPPFGSGHLIPIAGASVSQRRRSLSWSGVTNQVLDVSSLFNLTRRSVLSKRADRRGFFEPSLKDPLAKAGPSVMLRRRTPMRFVSSWVSNNASLLNRR